MIRTTARKIRYQLKKDINSTIIVSWIRYKGCSPIITKICNKEVTDYWNGKRDSWVFDDETVLFGWGFKRYTIFQMSEAEFALALL